MSKAAKQWRGAVIPLFTGLQDLWAVLEEPRSQLGWRHRRWLGNRAPSCSESCNSWDGGKSHFFYLVASQVLRFQKDVPATWAVAKNSDWQSFAMRGFPH